VKLFRVLSTTTTSLDFYSVLKVKRTATAEELKAAFHEQGMQGLFSSPGRLSQTLSRRAAKLHHPDIAGNSNESAEAFKAVNEAYSVLSDARERSLYDSTQDAVDPVEALRRRNEGLGSVGPRDVGIDPTYAGKPQAEGRRARIPIHTPLHAPQATRRAGRAA